jgi:hypothetical protein
MNKALSASEKRTIRLGATAVAICLALFCLQQIWKFFSSQNADYKTLLAQTDTLRAELRPYKGKTEDVRTLMEKFHMDPNHLSRTSVVAEASAALFKTAASSGIQLGPIRESATRQSAKEMAAIQLDCTGQVPNLLGFLHRFESMGYPIIIDAVQLTSDPTRPGNLKMHLGLVILDFEQWKAEERKPNA